jgi:hypothetical protein
MFRASQLYQVPIYLACIAAGAGGTWYLNRDTSPVPAPHDAAEVPHPARTVSWFEAHRAEMTQKMASCNDNPGGAMADPECENAATAKEHTDFKEFLAGAPK